MNMIVAVALAMKIIAIALKPSMLSFLHHTDAENDNNDREDDDNHEDAEQNHNNKNQNDN